MGRKTKERMMEEELELFKLKFSNPELVDKYNRLSKLPSRAWRDILKTNPELYQYVPKRAIRKHDLLMTLCENIALIDHIKDLKLSFSELTNIISSNPHILSDDILFNKFISITYGSRASYSFTYLIRNAYTHIDDLWNRFGSDILAVYDNLYYKTKFMLYMAGKVPKERLNKREWKLVMSVSDRFFKEIMFDMELERFISSVLPKLPEEEISQHLTDLFAMNNRSINTYASSLFSTHTIYSDINKIIEDTFSDETILKYVDINKAGNFGIDYITGHDTVMYIDFSKIKSQKVKYKLLYNISVIYGSSMSDSMVNILTSIQWKTLKGKSWCEEILSLMNEHGNKDNTRLVYDELDKKYATYTLCGKYL
jgi:hypothetical protein